MTLVIDLQGAKLASSVKTEVRTVGVIKINHCNSTTQLHLLHSISVKEASASFVPALDKSDGENAHINTHTYSQRWGPVGGEGWGGDERLINLTAVGEDEKVEDRGEACPPPACRELAWPDLCSHFSS